MPKRLLKEAQRSFSGGMVQNRSLPTSLWKNECEWLENLDLTEKDAAVKRTGWERMNSSALAGAVQGIAHMRTSDGVSHILVVAGGTLYFWNGTTFTSAASGFAGGTAVRACFVQFNDEMIWMNGVNAVQKYNPTTNVNAVLGGSPPVATFGAFHFNHLFLSGVTSNPTRVWYSETNDPADGYDATNYFADIAAGDSSPVRGFLSLDQDLLVGKENSITSIRGMNPRDFSQPQNRAAYTNEMGIINSDCVVDVDGRPWVLTRQGIYQLNGPFSLIEQSWPINGLLDRIDPFRIDRSFAFHSSERGQVFFCVPYFAGGPQMDIAFVGHPGKGRQGIAAWTVHTWPSGVDMTAAAVGWNTTDGEVLFMGDEDGFVYKMGTGYSDHLTAITAKYRSDDYDFGDEEQAKVLREIAVGAEVGAAASATVAYATDRGRQSGSESVSFAAPAYQVSQDATDPLSSRQLRFAYSRVSPIGARHQVSVSHTAAAEFKLSSVVAYAYSHGRRR